MPIYFWLIIPYSLNFIILIPTGSLIFIIEIILVLSVSIYSYVCS